MVKKLLKHELLSYLRIVLPIECVVLALAVLTRVLQVFEAESTIFAMVMGSGTFLFILSLFVSAIACYWVAVTRFYKNLFSGEGYLTFTLPITPAQHLWVKLAAALLVDICTLAVSALAVAIASAGDLLTETIKAAEYLLQQLFTVVEGTHIVLYVMEVLLLLLISRAFSYLLVYACVCLGQLLNKNRVLGAFGMYFAYTIVSQIFSTILSVVLTVLEEMGALETITTYISQHIYGTVHAALLGSGAWTVLLSAILFCICRHIMTKRLNLE